MSIFIVTHKKNQYFLYCSFSYYYILPAAYILNIWIFDFFYFFFSLCFFFSLFFYYIGRIHILSIIICHNILYISTVSNDIMCSLNNLYSPALDIIYKVNTNMLVQGVLKFIKRKPLKIDYIIKMQWSK